MSQVHTFEDVLNDSATRFGDQPFLMDDPLLGTISYSELWRFARGLEARFDELSIAPGAAVATLFHNCGLAAMLFLATIGARRLLVPLNPLSTSYELEYMLDKASCVAVIADPAHARSKEYGQRVSLEVSDHRSYVSQLCSKAKQMQDRGGTTVDALAGEIVFTSGSTGRPKGVVLSERSIIADALALANAYDLRSTDHFLTVCPLFHNSGQVFTTLACALCGGRTTPIRSDIGMLNFWAYIDKYRPQWSLGMNSFLALLLASSETPAHPESMRGLLTGGSAIDGSVVQRFESRFGVPIRTVYGLTETASISTCEHLDPSPRSLGSSGRPLAVCNVRIDSERAQAPDGTTLPYESGEILISGANLFEGYVGDPDLTLVRKRDGWLHTGDVGYFDEHGNLFVIDRIDSMLIVGGENVYPAEIEKLSTCLPGAAQTVLIGLDHPLWGKELVLTYKAERGHIPAVASWHRILASKLVAAKIPQQYVSIADLGLADFPRKENGKLDRRTLTALVKERVAAISGSSHVHDSEV
jgi:acyl-CoA synthetase (AMP-forming)/AMP-acid ligase II